ncbi:MAG: hypothetical protein K2W96_17740 [Gemmataceae bacterium]|nr:hypothetical protein [Gemmataceae bacterium]
MPNEADKKHLLKQLEKITDNPRLLVACTPPVLADNPIVKKAVDREKIFANHAYAVIGYDETTGKIKLRNPHNRPGQGGTDVFVSVEEFMLVFTTLAAESWVM